MNTRKYRWLLYTITLTIVATITVQVYWNYNNYLQNKQRVANEIQLSLDNALEEYFADIAKNDFLTIINPNMNVIDSSHIHTKGGGVFKQKVISWNNSETKKIDSVFQNIDIELNSKRFKKTDSISVIGGFKKTPPQFRDIRMIKKFNNSDSLQILNNLKSIYISISNDSINYNKLDSLVQNQLNIKDINTSYLGFIHSRNGSIIFNNAVKMGWSKNNDNIDSSENNKIVLKWNENETDSVFLKNVKFELKGVNSKSTFLRNNEQLKLVYGDTSFEALKRSSTGILLSLLLSLAIISCLFYLLKIINKQKQLAEIKNDLISNITHEFKTPITTVSTALEAIEMFNAIDDKEKTKKYLSISSQQLKKLHQMVEKLLETATLDSENLLLKKEKTDLVSLVKNASLKDEFLTTNKEVQFNTSKDEFLFEVDPFHFENAISNLIDNAIKYGGEKIEVHINFVLNNLEITIADNGVAIEKSQREKIFDQFYRIPKGNTHNVKGFGIGLYYTKKIIEKHGGEIHLMPNTANTTFKITLPI